MGLCVVSKEKDDPGSRDQEYSIGVVVGSGGLCVLCCRTWCFFDSGSGALSGTVVSEYLDTRVTCQVPS